MFQSTLPAKGATKCEGLIWEYRPVSIHAPREGSDNCQHVFCLLLNSFNPRSPRRERLFECPGGRGWTVSIHAPREGSDGRQHPAKTAVHPVSIHAPREGSDPLGQVKPPST